MAWWALLACSGSPDDGLPQPSDPEIPQTGHTGCMEGPDTCDGIDSDCDGQIDEDPDRSWYSDADSDGLGTGDAVIGCEAPLDHAPLPGDCDDDNPSLTGPLSDIRFRPVDAAVSGLTQPHWDGLYRPCVKEALGGGGALGDVDGDGDLDFFQPRLYLTDLLWLNDGTGAFTQAPGFSGDLGGSNGSLFVDVDGDRDLDLYVARLGPQANLLYINDGAGNLEEDAVARGADLPPTGCGDQWGVTASDIDGDGDLDLIVVGWTEKTVLGLRDRSRLLLNDGTGHFTDATVAWGLDALWQRAAFGALLADRDGDGDPDLHLIADWGGTGFWRNEGDHFVEIPGPFTDENGMGGDLGDIDGDGDLDWFVSSIYDPTKPCPVGWGCTGNRLYTDDGTGAFVDTTDAAGLREGQWDWGAVFLDDDLDGDLDLVMTAGMTAIEFWDDPGRMWRNDGTGVFTDTTCEAGWTFAAQGRTLLPGDLDRDGDLDLIVVGSTYAPQLWRAEGAEDRAWMTLSLEQPGPNPFGIGATLTVRATATSPAQVRLLHANSQFAGGPAPEVHFGLDDHVGPVHEVRVRWPDGTETVHGDVPVGVSRLTP